jgi:hypothetical protein
MAKKLKIKNNQQELNEELITYPFSDDTLESSNQVTDLVSEDLNHNDEKKIENPFEANSTSNHFFNFANSGNAVMFLTVIFVVLTCLINYKNFFNNYETVVLNEFKDLLYWSRFTLANFLIVAFVLYIFGIDLNKSIKEENKFVMLITIILFVITLIAGQKLFL